MYKAVNLNQATYDELHKIATQLRKPKAQVVESLVKDYSKAMKAKEKAKLEKFNREMKAKIKALKFSRKIKISTDDLDKDFAALADTDYMR